jgi:hypothetical protein
MTVGPNFSKYLYNVYVPHKLLRTLQRVAKPSNAALRQEIRVHLQRLETGPKGLGLKLGLTSTQQYPRRASKSDIEEPDVILASIDSR